MPITTKRSMGFGVLSSIMIALICIAGGIFCLVSNVHIASECTYKLEAEVTDIQSKTDDFLSGNKKKSTVVKRAYFTFEYNGVKYEDIKNSSGTNEDLYEIGEKVTLYINPDDPTKVYCPRDKKEYMTVGILFIVIGLIFAAVSFFKLRGARSDIAEAKDLIGSAISKYKGKDNDDDGACEANDYNYSSGDDI